MQDVIERDKEVNDRALLISVYNHQRQADEAMELLDELAELTLTFGAEIVAKQTIRIRGPQSRLLVGSGKAEEIIQTCHEEDINLIIFDDILTPGQQRNWEKLANMPVIDRHEVILDIFASRASTREAELQIELARSEYMLPRLKNAWTHLHRQRGGIQGGKGEGEKQIEIDGRLLRKQIVKLKNNLASVTKQRLEQRKKRQSIPIPNAAIVGYTNAGKSSLLNLLTDASVLVEDKLFATLDPTTRRIQLENNQTLLLSDTVGFIRKLPHKLVNAFKATLEEAVVANFLIHVVDASSSAAEDHIQTTEDVLEEIGAGGKNTILVFNKIDLLNEFKLKKLERDFPQAVFLSAKKKDNIGELLTICSALVDEEMGTMDLKLSVDAYDVLARLHKIANVSNERYEADGIYVTAAIPKISRHEFIKYKCDSL